MNNDTMVAKAYLKEGFGLLRQMYSAYKGGDPMSGVETMVEAEEVISNGKISGIDELRGIVISIDFNKTVKHINKCYALKTGKKD